MLLRDCFHAFADEIVKIGAATEKRKSKSSLTDRMATGIVGGAMASQVPGLVGSTAVAAMPKRPDNLPNVDQHHVQNMAKQMGVKQPVQYVEGAGNGAFHFHHDPQHQGMSTKFTGAAANKMGLKVDPQHAKHYVSSNARAGEAILAHELGHAKNLESWGKGWRYGAFAPSNALSRVGFFPSAAVAAGQEDPTWTPGLVQAGLSAPLLAEEGAASVRAARHLMKQHGAMRGLGKAMPLVPAWASYGALGITPLAITAGRKMWRNSHPPAQEGAAVASQ